MLLHHLEPLLAVVVERREVRREVGRGGGHLRDALEAPPLAPPAEEQAEEQERRQREAGPDQNRPPPADERQLRPDFDLAPRGRLERRRPPRRPASDEDDCVIRYSSFVIRYALFVIHYSLFVIRYWLFVIRYSFVISFRCSLFVRYRYSLFLVRYSLANGE